MGNIIGIIVFGAVVGALARLVLPGKQQISVLVTVIVGIVGALIGYAVAGALGVDNTKGVDWIRDLISVAIAVVLVIVAERVMALRGKKA